MKILYLLCVILILASESFALEVKTEQSFALRQPYESFRQKSKGTYSLQEGDKIVVPEKNSVTIVADDESRFIVGEKSILRIEEYKKEEGLLEIFLIRGSIRSEVKSKGNRVKTFSAKIYLQNGLNDIMVGKGKTLAVSRKGRGAVIYSTHHVQKLKEGQKALINQKGQVKIQSK